MTGQAPTPSTAEIARHTTTVIQKISTFPTGVTKASCEVYIGQNLIALGEDVEPEGARSVAARDLRKVTAALVKTLDQLENS